MLEAIDAGEARQALSGRGGQIDIALIDVKGAPSEDGFTLAMWIRSAHPAIKVLMGGTVAKVLHLAGELCNEGPDGHLDHRSVLDHIRRLLAGRDSAR